MLSRITDYDGVVASGQWCEGHQQPSNKHHNSNAYHQHRGAFLKVSPTIFHTISSHGSRSPQDGRIARYVALVAMHSSQKDLGTVATTVILL